MGIIPSKSSLFQLSHLRKLDLSENDFNGSSISPAFGRHFPHLTHLDLSYSNFSGSIPTEIAYLSKLISLIIQPAYMEILRLGPQDFEFLINNQTQLERLFLSGVNISSPIPEYIGNLSSLSYIDLSISELYGEVPHRIFDLPNLKELELSWNDRLVGYLPKPNVSCSSSLTSLNLRSARFSSELHDASHCLKSLSYLGLSGGEFYGSIPPWLGNFSQLSGLDLSRNIFTGQVPVTLSNLQHLDSLNLYGNYLEGEIPDAFAQLTNLIALDLSRNNFQGKFPLWLANLTEIRYLDLQSNNLAGPIPSNISELRKLESLALSHNSFRGALPLGLFSLPLLYAQVLSSNQLSGTIPSNTSELQNMKYLYLNNNSIGGAIPLSLFAIPSLSDLDLNSNQLSGTIPSNLTGTFQSSAVHNIDLSNNYLSGTIEPLSFVNLKSLYFLHLSHNSLQGPLPLIPLSTSYLLISNNKFHGDIPPSICDTRNLEIIDLSHNNLSGVIPKCISNFSNALSVLNLGMNGLSGTIPMNFAKGNLVRSINLNGNYFEGKVLRSLANCMDLEVLDLGKNNINDIFPYWLESLPDLQVLVLRHNKFHGMVEFSEIKKVASFQKLRIFDLSHNKFSGPLPINYILSLNAMRNVNHTQTTLEYMGNSDYDDTVVINWKGVVFEVRRILKVLATIDFSGNRFEGEIPNDMGNLLGIQSLNLSSNILTGHIPSTLANLRLLESLDLSSNQLSGVIPQELTHITTLGVLNLSSNHLTGPIPRGFQFNTFQNDSYIGNLELCGQPLSKKCSDNGAPDDQPSQDDDEEGIFDGFGWKVVLLGYGCGTVFGLGVGFVMFSTGKPKRLVKFVEDELIRITKRSGKSHAEGNRNAQRRG